NQAQNWLTTKVPPGRMGHAHPNIVPYQAFEASDGWFILATGNDRQYASVCQVVARDDLLLPHLLTNEGRLEHRETVISTLNGIFVTKKVEHWIAAFSAVGVPTAPIHDIAQAFADPQAIDRDDSQEPASTQGSCVTTVHTCDRTIFGSDSGYKRHFKSQRTQDSPVRRKVVLRA
ncbi:MAG: CoA transferase, partial [Planctomycetaceae bacterium]